MPNPEKFRDTLVEYGIQEGTILRINKGFETITSKILKKIKAAYFSQALRIMENELGEAKTQEIFIAKGCCKTGARLAKSKEFARISEGLSIEEKLAKIRKAHYMNMGSPEFLENGDIMVYAVKYMRDWKYACACPNISNQLTQPKDKITVIAVPGTFNFTTRQCWLANLKWQK